MTLKKHTRIVQYSLENLLELKIIFFRNIDGSFKDIVFSIPFETVPVSIQAIQHFSYYSRINYDAALTVLTLFN